MTKSGTSIKKGELILSRGTVIGPAQISTLISVGTDTVNVIRKPLIGIISSGDELIDLGQPLSPCKSYNCNTMAVASLIKHYGGIPKILGIARDNEKSIKSKILKGLKLDAIITSGGVSKGDFDLTRKVIEEMGLVLFATIKMGPGAAVGFGILNRDSGNENSEPVPIFALSGVPSGCVINCETLVRPAILKMMGYKNIAHPVVKAIAKDSVSRRKSKAYVQWSKLERFNDGYQVEINRSDNIGKLTAIMTANSFTIIPEETVVHEGDIVQVLPLDWIPGNM
jgi:molybdopterin molybdotransferase